MLTFQKNLVSLRSPIDTAKKIGKLRPKLPKGGNWSTTWEKFPKKIFSLFLKVFLIWPAQCALCTTDESVQRQTSEPYITFYTPSPASRYARVNHFKLPLLFWKTLYKLSVHVMLAESRSAPVALFARHPKADFVQYFFQNIKAGSKCLHQNSARLCHCNVWKP